MPPMPLSRADLLARLAALGIETVTYDHDAVFTVAESTPVKASIPGGHTKNLFLKDRRDRVFLVVAEGHAVIDLKRIHDKIGAHGRVSFAKPDLLYDLLGVLPGSVTAFGVVNDVAHRVTVVIDAPLLAFDVINCHPLENTATTSIRRDDLLAFLAATGHPPLIVTVSGAPARPEAT
jgi:Ala-tRNA(Pro) deacylase